MPSPPTTAVRDNPDANRYELYVDGELAGVAVYRSAPGRVVFLHTEVDDEREGHGLGSTLVREALDDVRRRGRRVTPSCPFVGAFIGRHPEYLDLVDDEHRGSLAADHPSSNGSP